jgi:hypothetical protein
MKESTLYRVLYDVISGNHDFRRMHAMFSTPCNGLKYVILSNIYQRAGCWVYAKIILHVAMLSTPCNGLKYVILSNIYQRAG